MKKNILIKASGDIIENDIFLQFCHQISENTKHNIVIICGAGKQINNALSQEGYDVNYCDMGERVICSPDAEKIVRKTLKTTRNRLRKTFMEQQNITVKGSWEKIAGVYCHINADTLVLTYYLGFDEIYVFTFQGNKKKKEKSFEKYPKVTIIEI